MSVAGFPARLWGGLPTAPPFRPQVSTDAHKTMTTERFRICDDAHVYFVTYTIVQWLPVFVSEEACRIVTNSLNFCQEQKGLCTNAYVIMPTHLHAIFSTEHSITSALCGRWQIFESSPDGN